MISTMGGAPGGGFGGTIGAGGPLTPQGLFQLIRWLGGKRNTQDLGPGSFPGYDPQGNPIDDTEDPYKYASFSMPPTQTPGINPGASTPNAGGGTFGGAARLPSIPWPGSGGGGGTQGRTGTNTPGGGIGGFLRQNAGNLIGAGTQLIGAKMASGQMNRANQIQERNSNRSYELALEEKRRRDMLIQMMMPQILRDMGVNDKEKAQQMIGRFPGGQ